MTKITRKQFLREITAGCFIGCFPFPPKARANPLANTQNELLIPYPARSWAQTTRLVGSRAQLDLATLKDKPPNFDRLPLYNDFCLVQGIDDIWHCIGILFEGNSKETFRQDRLFHYVSEKVDGPYRSAGYIDLGYGAGSGVWAPFIVRQRERALMCYATVGNGGVATMTIRVAQSSSAQLNSWQRGSDGTDIWVAEYSARDPDIIRDSRTGLYLLYYCSAVKVGSEWQKVVRVKSSADLNTWSEPHTVLSAPPPGYGTTESVFVLERNGYYYMWISGYDYARMSLYISTDPLNFGDADSNRIEEQPGHACEIIYAKGRYWMACVAIASVPGLSKVTHLPISQHDLEGVYIQPLEWRAADSKTAERVSGSRNHGLHK